MYGERSCYYDEYAEYIDTIAIINQGYKDSGIVLYACIEDKTISLHYAEIADKNAFDDVRPIEKLKQKDKRKREISVEKTVAEVKNLIEDANLTIHEFTTYEDKLLYYMIFSTLKGEHYSLLGIAEKTYFQSDTNKVSILNNLIEETKTIILQGLYHRRF